MISNQLNRTFRKGFLEGYFSGSNRSQMPQQREIGLALFFMFFR